MAFAVVTAREILALLQARSPLVLPSQHLRPAAVLVPLIERGTKNGELDVLLTRRSSDLGSHAGQVSFPGGRVEPDVDASFAAAALRETHEELGIAPTSVQLLGQLDDMYTVTGYHITPVVGLVHPDVRLVPDPREVARVFRVPLATLMNPASWEQRQHRYGEATYRIWHLPFDGEDIWGATAEMLHLFIELLWGQP